MFSPLIFFIVNKHNRCCCCFFSFEFTGFVRSACHCFRTCVLLFGVRFFFIYVGLILMRISSIQSIRVEMNLRQKKNEIKNKSPTHRERHNANKSNVSKLLLEGAPLAIIIIAYHLDGFFFIFRFM